MVTNQDIIQVLLGEASDDLKKSVFDEVKASKAYADEYYRLKNEFALLASNKNPDLSKVRAALTQLERRIDETKKTTRKKMWFTTLRYAAALALIIGMSSTLYYTFSKRTSRILTSTIISTANGQQSTVLLPDSSKVVLNYGSRLEFNNEYGITNRILKFSGQALFEITKNKQLPVLLHTKGLDVEVKGTTFDVNAYPNDSNITVALYTGIVELSSTDKSLQYSLKPGNIVVFNKKNKTLAAETQDMNKISSWRNGIFMFENSNMQDVIKKLERKYNLKIMLQDSEILKSAFTATIKNEDYSEIFKQIEFACNVKCKISLTPDSSTQATIYIKSR